MSERREPTTNNSSPPDLLGHAHSHGHAHGHSHDRNAGSDNMRWAFFLNLGFALIELLGGFYTNSLAIMADALHDFGDATAIAIGWWLERRAGAKPNAQFSYGLRRLSLLGALFNTVIIFCSGMFILVIAIPRLWQPQSVQATGMFALAVLGVAVNAYGASRLRRDRTLNAQVMAWHLYEDLLGWLAVLVVSAVMWWRPTPILDPLLAIMITVFVLWNIVRHLRRILALLLQGVPDNIDLKVIEQQLQQLAQVLSCHHTHIWSLDGEHHVLTTHLLISRDCNASQIQEIKRAVQTLASGHGFSHTTIEIECVDADCSMAAKPD